MTVVTPRYAAQLNLDLGPPELGIAIRIEQTFFGPSNRCLDRPREWRRLRARTASGSDRRPRSPIPFARPRPSRSQGKYKPPLKPPQALKVQSTPRRRPLPSITNVGPQSRIHASLLLISTRALRAASARAHSGICVADTPTVTGSAPAMAVAIAANAACAGLAPERQLSGRSGHSIQQPSAVRIRQACESPSFAGVDVSVRNAGLRARMLALPLILQER